MYAVTVTVPPGWVDFDVEVEGATGYPPQGVTLVSTGTITYFPPNRLVAELSGTLLNVYYGAVFNADSNSTVVSLEVAFSTSPTLAAGTKPGAILSVGTKAVNNTPSFQVVAKTGVSFFCSSFSISYLYGLLLSYLSFSLLLRA